jgi:transposase
MFCGLIVGTCSVPHAGAPSAPSRIHKRSQPRGSGLGGRRWPVERSNAWVLENKRLALRYDRLGFVMQSLLQAACIFLVAGRPAGEF